MEHQSKDILPRNQADKKNGLIYDLRILRILHGRTSYISRRPHSTITAYCLVGSHLVIFRYETNMRDKILSLVNPLKPNGYYVYYLL
jgi:hypothetical protein